MDMYNQLQKCNLPEGSLLTCSQSEVDEHKEFPSTEGY